MCKTEFSIVIIATNFKPMSGMPPSLWSLPEVSVYSKQRPNPAE